MYGELPFHNAAIEARTSNLEFTPDEWQVVQQAASREGYGDAKPWIVEKIRSYLRMNPQTAHGQIAAEAADKYNASEED